MTAIAVTIAGSDSGGGAGIQADLKTFSALGVYGASVLTALTAQNTRGVTAILDIPLNFIDAQMDAVFSDLKVDAVKIGMLSRPEVIRTVAAGLKRYQPPVVVLDPVMVAASGDVLLAPEAVAELVDVLFPEVQLITPNMPEAARLLGCGVASGRREMQEQAERLLALGAKAVLLKGGHGEGAESDDLLHLGKTQHWFCAPRHATSNTHGTGCTLSSAIVSGLAKGLSMVESVAAAKLFVTGAIKAADTLNVGTGHGPVHHFHRQWAENDK